MEPTETQHRPTTSQGEAPQLYKRDSGHPSSQDESQSSKNEAVNISPPHASREPSAGDGLAGVNQIRRALSSEASSVYDDESTHSDHASTAVSELPDLVVRQDEGVRARKTSTLPAELDRVHSTEALRKWVSETHRPVPHSHAPYPLRRVGTSYLDQALFQGCQDEQSSTSSSSEPDEAEGNASREPQSHAASLERRWQKEAEAERRKHHHHHNPVGDADADDQYRKFLVGNENYQSKGRIKKDGRLSISVKETAYKGYIAKTLGGAIHTMKSHMHDNARVLQSDSEISATAIYKSDDIPKLNIVIMVIGSRGDVQPFLRIGKVLKENYGHRVRIATHPAYRDFVEKDSQLEFFSVGGDPSELMAFMVKNPGLIPTLDTVKSGEIGKRRAAMAEMFDGFWRACINATDDDRDDRNLKMMGSKAPFVADAIIANPPSFAHIHCAEALGIPLHLMFTFPYTPTQAFPHPLASIKKSNVDPGYTNFISYPIVEMMVWQGLGDLVNDFRVKTLALDPVSTLWAPGATYRLHVPFTYLWSPGIVPKPKDWGPNIDVAGFVYLNLASTYVPPPELEEFLNAGDMPIYIGFGSIVVDDADRFTQLIFEATEKSGVRALVSRGWGGLGGGNTPKNVYMLENTPHDWLFPRVKACVIHGGAGTTAIALKCGKPTMIVPFFGDQHFWGQMVHNSHVGPEPVPYKFLTVDKLTEGIQYLLTDEAQIAANKIAAGIEVEGDGAVNACEVFHKNLKLRGPKTMRCSIFKDRVATWQPKNTHIKLSPLAADILVDRGLITWKQLKLLRHADWNDFEGPGEPVTGIAGSLARSVGHAFKGVGGVPFHLARTGKKRRLHRKSLEAGRQSQDAPNGALPGQIDLVAAPNGNLPIPATELDRALQAHAGAQDLPDEYVDNLTQGVGRTAFAIAKAPVELSLALAQGFHNAPRLYGDDTVRRPPRVTGVHSGLKAARKEFMYGVYDGFTGIVRLPIRGAQADGVVGFAKGTGMGLVGFVLKNLSAIFGPFSYTMKGLVKQAERSKQPRRLIRRAHIAQGQRDVKAIPATQAKKMANGVERGWHMLNELEEAIGREEKKRGLAGHIDRMMLDTGMLFENVEIAKKALVALQRGDTLDSVVRPEGRKKGVTAVRSTLNRKGDKALGKDGEEKTRRGTDASEKTLNGTMS